MTDEETKKYIYNNFNLLDSDQLLEIWQKNDRVEYTDVAFEVLRDLLAERGCEIPAQGDPVTEHPVVRKPRERRDLPEILEKVDPIVETNSGSAAEPQFYKPASVIRIQRWLNRIAIATVVVKVIQALVMIINQYRSLPQALAAGYQIGIQDYLLFASYVITVLITCTIIYAGLKTLGTILISILEIETASRKQPALRQEA